MNIAKATILLTAAFERLTADGVLPLSPNIVTLGGLVGRIFADITARRGSMAEDVLRDRLLDVAVFALAWVEADKLGEGSFFHTKEKTR